MQETALRPHTPRVAPGDLAPGPRRVVSMRFLIRQCFDEVLKHERARDPRAHCVDAYELGV